MLSRTELEALRDEHKGCDRKGCSLGVQIIDSHLHALARAEKAERRLKEAREAWGRYCASRSETDAKALDAALQEEQTDGTTE